MKSLTELYKIGKGPSSSHTMGPQKAAKIYAKRHPDAHLFDVTLYGSLAATGKGHMTDTAIIEVLSPIATVNIHWEPNIFLPYHPNGMKFTADGADEWIVYSVGGGALSEGKAEDMFDTPEVYEMNSLSEILTWCDQNGRSYWEYVDLCEGDVVWPYLQEVWETMQECVDFINRKYGEGTASVEIKHQYYNMRKMVEPHYHIIEKAVKAMEMEGIKPRIQPIRGGTDGANLSFKGLPCPNIFAGGHNFHGKLEFVPLESMIKASKVILNIISLFAE